MEPALEHPSSSKVSDFDLKDSPFAPAFEPEKPEKKKHISFRIDEPEGLPECSQREKMILIGVAAVLVTVTVLVLVLVLDDIALLDQKAMCEDIEMREKTGKSGYAEHMITKPTINDLYLCHSIRCSFDVMQCKNLCPFGFEMDEQDCAVSCDCAAEGVTQGDMRFDEHDVPVLLDEFGFKEKRKDFTVFGSEMRFPLWTKKTAKGNVRIPYVLNEDLTEEQVESWDEAVAHLKEKTCIRFKERKSDMDYLHVTKTSHKDCSSFIGRKGGKQDVSMASCYSWHHIEHLLMHALGFQHEHTRYDRDAYIKIVFENVLPEHKLKFTKEHDKKKPYHTNFDKESVTMFNGSAYSVADDKPTILDIDTSQPLIVNVSSTFSHNDILDIKSLYCKKGSRSGRLRRLGKSSSKVQAEDIIWSSWGLWSHCDATCGSSKKNRYRECYDDSGTEQTGSCDGGDVMTIRCKTLPCPERDNMVALWGRWSEFGDCSATCGTGIMYRFRRCSDGVKEDMSCVGNDVEAVECNTFDCTSGAVHYFDPWTNWSECSRTCGGGLRERYRECKDQHRKRARYCDGIVDNDGLEYQSVICNVGPCPGGKTGIDFYSNSLASKYMEEPKWFSRAIHTISASACSPVSSTLWLIGDFNGDERQDILCENPNEEAKIILGGKGRIDEVSWKGKLEACRRPMIYSGDFNGDGTSDILCIATDGVDSGLLIYPGENGRLNESVAVGEFCLDSNLVRYIVDLNSDGRDDLICRDPSPNSNSTLHFNVWT